MLLISTVTNQIWFIICIEIIGNIPECHPVPQEPKPDAIPDPFGIFLSFSQNVPMTFPEQYHLQNYLEKFGIGLELLRFCCSKISHV